MSRFEGFTADELKIIRQALAEYWKTPARDGSYLLHREHLERPEDSFIERIAVSNKLIEEIDAIEAAE